MDINRNKPESLELDARNAQSPIIRGIDGVKFYGFTAPHTCIHTIIDGGLSGGDCDVFVHSSGFVDRSIIAKNDWAIEEITDLTQLDWLWTNADLLAKVNKFVAEFREKKLATVQSASNPRITLKVGDGYRGNRLALWGE